jgi:hypothetical protein
MFAIEVFFITAPYFLIILLGLFFFGLFKGTFTSRGHSIVVLLLALSLIAIYNFSTVRFSMPIFFLLFSMMLSWILSTLKDRVLNLNVFLAFYILYLMLSLPFLFMSTGYINEHRFMGFMGSPTIYSGFLTAIFVVITLSMKQKSWRFLLLYLITFTLVYITKTRLLIVFLLLYPILRELLQSKIWITRKNVFFAFYGVTFFIYPLYNRVTDLFPGLIAIRYGNKEDTSFSLRNYLFLECEKEFYAGNWKEIILGKGNEYSRNFVKGLLNIDLMPHNDYMRILIDWGILGFLIFSILIYKLAIKNNYTLFLVLVYMILFYSNTVFNMYIISIILILYFKDESNLSKYQVVFKRR